MHTLSNNQQVENQGRERRAGGFGFFVHNDTNFLRFSGFTSDQYQTLTAVINLREIFCDGCLIKSWLKTE